MSCTRCDDTGSLSKNPYGHLDCPHCEASTERAALDGWMRDNAFRVDAADAWAIYQHGKAAARRSSRAPYRRNR